MPRQHQHFMTSLPTPALVLLIAVTFVVQKKVKATEEGRRLRQLPGNRCVSTTQFTDNLQTMA
jgi:hypothetical protein